MAGILTIDWPSASSAIATLASHRATERVWEAVVMARNPAVMTRQLFLIAGSAGSGKSTMAKAMAHHLDAGWLQLDSIWLAMKAAVDEGTPEHNVLDIDRRLRRADEADDDLLAAHIAASTAVCRGLPIVLEFELQAHQRLVADGAWLLPSWARELQLPDTDIRVVYVVHRTEADAEAALTPRRGGLPLEDRHRHMNRRIFQYGAWLAHEAQAHDLPVVEALPFETLLGRALAAFHTEVIGPDRPGSHSSGGAIVSLE
jgi:2-phosphoglycerate kinase